jgi:hypothetical protein
MITHCGLLWHCYVSRKSVACGKRQEQNLSCLSGDAPNFNRGRMSRELRDLMVRIDAALLSNLFPLCTAIASQDADTTFILAFRTYFMKLVR